MGIREMFIGSLAAVLAVPLLAGSVVAQNGPYDLSDTSMTCYKGKQNKGTAKLPKGMSGTLDDAFHSNDYAIKKIGGLCISASVDGGTSEAISSTSWKIKGVKGSPKASPQTGIRVFNSLGDLSLDTKKEAGALVSTSGGLKCWKAKVTKGTAKFPKGVQVTVSDAINASTRTFDIKKPALICNTISQLSGAEAAQPVSTICYKAKAAKGEAKDSGASAIEVTDSVLTLLAGGSTQVDVKKISTVCVSALRSPPAEFCGDGTINQSEECDGSGSACFDGIGTCTTDCACDVPPALGSRTISLGSDSGFFTSFIPGNPIASPGGALTLEAGIPHPETGIASVSLAGQNPQIVSIPIPLGGVTLCYEYQSCSGTIYCSGGQNVDSLVELDSLNASRTCQRLGNVGWGLYHPNCPDEPGNVCCTHSCEGFPGNEVGSGNSEVMTVPAGTADSGAGALVMTCNIRVSQEDMDADCAQANFDDDVVAQQVLTTGATTVRMLNHCAGPATSVGNNAGTTPEFTKAGENFVCADWSVEDSAGSLTWGIATEQPTPLLPGDGSQVAIYDD